MGTEVPLGWNKNNRIKGNHSSQRAARGLKCTHHPGRWWAVPSAPAQWALDGGQETGYGSHENTDRTRRPPLGPEMARASLNTCCTHPSNTLPSSHCTGRGSALCLSILIIASLPKLPGPSCWVAAQPWTHLTFWETPYALSILPISLARSLSLSLCSSNSPSSSPGSWFLHGALLITI